MSDLGTFPGGLHSFAYGINDLGQVVGEAGLADGTTSHAFVWDGGGLRDLGTLAGGTLSAAFAITSTGLIAGQSTTVVDTGEHGVLWQLDRSPVANPQSVTTPRDVPVTITLTGTDPDGEVVTFAVVGNPVHGTVTGIAPSLVYTPAAGFVGTDSLTFTVSADGLTSAAATVTISVTGSGDPTGDQPPGHMHGHGDLAGAPRHRFEFKVRETSTGTEKGRLRYWGKRRGASRWTDWDEFVSTRITQVDFSDDPALRPGPSGRFRAGRVKIDTVRFVGTGRWNGLSGHTFEARASDAGEPGRGRDTFALTIRNPAGDVVATLQGTLGHGNIQSLRLRNH